MRITIYIAVLVSLAFFSFSQRFVEPDKMKSFNITVNYPDYTVKTQMLKDPKKMALDVDLTYHWYTSQKIMETKGGFDGKLLHGYYRSFYLNDQLFESGQFKYGVKSGEWKNWYPDGKIKEVTHWKNGKKNGKYKLYNNNGNLIATGKFNKDQLTGEFKTYDSNGKVSLVTKYKNGQIVTPKENNRKKKIKSNGTLKPKEEPKQPLDEKDLNSKTEKTKKNSIGRKIKLFFNHKVKKENQESVYKNTTIAA